MRFAHAPLRPVGARLLEEDARLKAREERHRRLPGVPGREHRARGEHGVRRGARDAVRRQDEERRLVEARAAREAQPHGVVEAPARDARETEVEDDEREARREHRLARGERRLQPARAQPEEAGEVDAGVGGALRVEVVAGIDERGGLARLRRGGEGGKGRREEPARGGDPPADLHQRAPRQAPAQQPVQCRDARGQARGPPVAPLAVGEVGPRRQVRGDFGRKEGQRRHPPKLGPGLAQVKRKF